MEQVFDLREFLLMLWKKGKNVVIVAVIFAILGGAFGFVRFPKEDKIMSTSTASVGLVDKNQDATALSNAMIMTNAYLVSDTFYTEMLNELSQYMEQDSLKKLFGGDTTPKLADIKQVLKVQTKGNIVIVDVTATDAKVPTTASELCIKYIVSAVPKFNENLEAKELGNEVINVTLQNNDTLIKEIIKFGILGFGGGIVLSILAIFFVDVFNLKLKNADQLKKLKKPVLDDGVDRAVAVIKNSIGQEPMVITVCSTGGVDVTAVAGGFKEAFERIGLQFAIVNCKGKKLSEAAKAEINDNTILCCDDINVSTETMYYVAKSSGVVLCEKLKQSHTDKIEAAITEIENLDSKLIGIYID